MKWPNPHILSLAVILLGGVAASEAASSIHLTLMTHSAFFSAETHQPKPIDPQVFVRDSAATGPREIHHIAGVRPALVDQDAKTTPLVNANGKPLRFDLADWLGAQGAVTIIKLADGKAKVAALRPRGDYSLFANHFDQNPVGFPPLDGMGKASNFVANRNGTARVTITAPRMVNHANAALLECSTGRNARSWASRPIVS